MFADQVGKTAFEKGLEPLDFIKASSSIAPDNVDELHAIGVGLETMALPKNHINNVLTDEELESLCYKRMGKVPSYLGYQSLISKVIDVEPEWLPPGLVDAQLVMSYEKSLGRRSYKNFLRRVKHMRKQQAKRNRLSGAKQLSIGNDEQTVKIPCDTEINFD
jgi:hypothetical protein